MRNYRVQPNSLRNKFLNFQIISIKNGYQSEVYTAKINIPASTSSRPLNHRRKCRADHTLPPQPLLITLRRIPTRKRRVMALLDAVRLDRTRATLPAATRLRRRRICRREAAAVQCNCPATGRGAGREGAGVALVVAGGVRDRSILGEDGAADGVDVGVVALQLRDLLPLHADVQVVWRVRDHVRGTV